MTAIEHQYDSGDPIVSARRGLTGRMQSDGIHHKRLFLGDYVAGGSPADGFDPRVRYPVMLPSEFEQNHLLILGPTRSGKTSRGLMPLIEQKIPQNTGPNVITDFKGDDVMFHRIRNVCEKAGRPFKYLTNVPWLNTYLFSPWDQSAFDRLSLSQFVQLNMAALDLWHGSGYGRGFYSAQSRSRFLEALKFEGPRVSRGRRQWQPSRETHRITSFEEAYQRVKELNVHSGSGDAQQLLMALQDLTHLTPLNFERDGRRMPAEAIAQAIRVDDLVRRDENGMYPVVYFYLRSGAELVGAAQIVKLFIYCLYQAQMQARDFHRQGLREEPAPEQVWIAIDEWQRIADDSIRNILEQASGAGLHFALANQDISQLRQGGMDLVETVWENCGNKMIFSCRDPELQDRLIKISGEKTVHVASYQVSHEAYRAGKVEPQYAIQIANGEFQGVAVTQQRAPRFDRNLLIETSNHPSRCIYVPPQSAAGIDFGGYPVILDCSFHLTREEYAALSARRWPEATRGTIVAEEFDRCARSSSDTDQNTNQHEPRKRVVE